VFGNKVLRRNFGPGRDEVMGGWRKLHSGEIRNMYTSLNIIRMIKSRRVRWERHVESITEMRNTYKILLGECEGKRATGRHRHRWAYNIKMDVTK
jgi:hypothetical protein